MCAFVAVLVLLWCASLQDLFIDLVSQSTLVGNIGIGRCFTSLGSSDSSFLGLTFQGGHQLFIVEFDVTPFIRHILSGDLPQILLESQATAITQIRICTFNQGIDRILQSQRIQTTQNRIILGSLSSILVANILLCTPLQDTHAIILGSTSSICIHLSTEAREHLPQFS